MSTLNKNLSEFNTTIPKGGSYKIAIVRSEWNEKVTSALLEGAMKLLNEAGVKKENIHIKHVPGTFELPLAAQWYAKKSEIDGVICLGCVIQGETKHFDFICHAAANGIMEVGLKFNKPVIFGVLTTNNQEQAEERAGGKHGNKGEEAAYTLLRMLSF